MNGNDLKTILKRPGIGIKSTIGGGIGAKVRREGQVSELERRAGYAPIRSPGIAIPYKGRCHVIVKVYRRRLTDPLGDCHKYHIDSLRYCGCLAEDSDAAIRLTDEGHEKVETNEEERVEITVEYPITLVDLIYAYKDGPRKIT